MTTLQEIAAATSSISMRKLLSGSSAGDARNSKIGRLYRYLKGGKLEEETIVKKLYGAKAKPGDGRYKTLKSRLKRIMLNSLLNGESMSGRYTTYDEAYITGYQQLGLCRLLTVKRAYRAAEEVATHAFRNVRKYEIMTLNEGFTDILSALYLGILQNPPLFQKYYKLHEYYAQGYIDFNIVARKYRMMRNKVYAHKESTKEIGEFSLQFVKEVEEIMLKYPTVPALQAMIRNTWILGLKLSGRYQEGLQAANETEKILSQCEGVSDLVISAIALTRVECSLHLRNFELGKKQVDKTRPMILEKTINSIKLSEYAVLLGLQTGNYDYAFAEFVSLDRETLNKLPSESSTEIWRILEAYIRFLILAGKINARSDDKRKQKFRVARFINNVPVYAANKRGMNIQIIVIQAMFFILRDEHSTFIDRTDALARYCTRYLKDNDDLRHNCFFKLLIEVVKGNFRLDARKRRIKVILERMTSPDAQEIGRMTNAEIVPYEVLWDILCSHLGYTNEAVPVSVLDSKL